MLDSRKPKQKYDENKVVSIIGPGTKVKGEVVTQGTIRVEGGVEGLKVKVREGMERELKEQLKARLKKVCKII